MKRFSIVILMLTAILSLLAACSESSSNDEADTEKQKLVIGIDDTFAPMGFRDENNEIVGFDIDMATAAAEKMGKELEFQPIDWSTKESELNSGRIDLIWNGYTITDERKEKVLFTEPYLENHQVIVTLKDSKISSIDDLAGKTVGLQALSSAGDALNAHPIQADIKTLTEYKTNVLALNDLKIGRLDAVVIDEVVIDYYMSKETDTYKILDESLAPEQYGVGVKKENEELLNALQKALDEMKEDGTSAEISEKWFGADKVLN
ncbi:MAG: amino acid ABC transporter substrate-binding protein [Bacillus sp. (in: firmicutes)]